MPDSHFLNEPNGFDMSRIISGIKDLTLEAADTKTPITIKVAPVHGVVTATSATSVLLKAGGSELAGRTKMIVKNSSRFQVKIGASSGDAIYQLGIPVDPGQTETVEFDPTVAVSVYARSQGGAARLEVTEA
jgi:hypothetical protein